MDAAPKVGVDGLAGSEEVDGSVGVEVPGDDLQTVGGQDLQPAQTDLSCLLLPDRVTTLERQMSDILQERDSGDHLVIHCAQLLRRLQEWFRRVGEQPSLIVIHFVSLKNI